MRRAAIFVTSAVALLCVWLGSTYFAANGPGSMAFAQVFDQIQQAKTVTWKTTIYERFTSKDGKRTWLEATTVQCAYKSPGLFREAWPDTRRGHGRIDIFDVRQKEHRQLTLRPSEKKASLIESTNSCAIRLDRSSSRKKN